MAHLHRITFMEGGRGTRDQVPNLRSASETIAARHVGERTGCVEQVGSAVSPTAERRAADRGYLVAKSAQPAAMLRVIILCLGTGGGDWGRAVAGGGDAALEGDDKTTGGPATAGGHGSEIRWILRTLGGQRLENRSRGAARCAGSVENAEQVAAGVVA